MDGMEPKVTPNSSINLSDHENFIMRLPNKSMHHKNEENLQQMLGRINQYPDAFRWHVSQRRDPSLDKDNPQNNSPPEDTPNPLSVAKKYKAESIMGRGRYSVVFKGRRLSDNKRVALKRVALSSAQIRSKSLREVRLLRSLRHPNIIKYHDCFVSKKKSDSGPQKNPSILFIVLEWAGAGDLNRLLQRVRDQNARLHERVVWAYFLQVCEGVKFMHENRIMHRDIKPANIFIMPNGHLKLGDLGLCRPMGEDTEYAFSKVGTPLYMSPEVLQGKGYDFKSDVWSLGCVLYQLAMLKSPFTADSDDRNTMYQLFNRILRAEYEDIPSAVYSPEIKALVRSMLVTKVEERASVYFVCAEAAQASTLTPRTRRNKSTLKLAPIPDARKPNVKSD